MSSDNTRSSKPDQQIDPRRLVEECPVLILAAGFGKRLGELTKDLPKPLIKVAGKPLIDWTLSSLQAQGFKRVFINLHYRGEQIREHVFRAWGSLFSLTFVEEPVILDTGGAIKNIEPLLRPGDSLFTVNADTVVGRDFSFAALLESHLQHPARPLASLVVQNRADAANYGELGLTSTNLIGSFIGKEYRSDVTQRSYVYLGIQLLSPALFGKLPKRGEIFSITKDSYASLLASGEAIAAFEYSGFWSDVGTPERLAAAEVALRALA